jgi:hypothetical protein
VNGDDGFPAKYNNRFDRVQASLKSERSLRVAVSNSFPFNFLKVAAFADGLAV